MTAPPKTAWVDPELDGFQPQGPPLNAETLSRYRQASDPGGKPQQPEPEVTVNERFVPGPPGAPEVRVLVYRPKEATDSLPALLWLHGGSYVMGSADSTDATVKALVVSVGCGVVSVDYRLAPETPFPGAIEDCYAALKWLQTSAAELGVDAERLAVGGQSSGAGLAAALALLARDRDEVPLRYQLLLYPMLDDRTMTDPDPNPYTVKWDGLRFGWTSLLGHSPGQAGVSSYAAPARAELLESLPPAFIAVGALDLFVDESLGYAHRLIRSGVPTELHVYPGAYHAFDVLAKEAEVSRDFTRGWTRALRRGLGLD